jgi:rpsU-divergently transcribed protein
VVRKGTIEVVDFAMQTWLKQMREDLEQKDMKEMKIRDRIHFGVKSRLSLVIPYQDVWPQAMALGLKPQNLMSTLQQIHQISD